MEIIKNYEGKTEKGRKGINTKIPTEFKKMLNENFYVEVQR